MRHPEVQARRVTSAKIAFYLAGPHIVGPLRPNGYCRRSVATPKTPQKNAKSASQPPLSACKTTKSHFFLKKNCQNFAGIKTCSTFALANQAERHNDLKAWSLRLSVRTRDFHSLKRSSTLLGTTNNRIIRNGKPQIICKKNSSDGVSQTAQQILR